MEYPKKLSFDRRTARLGISEKAKNLEYFSITSTDFDNYALLICGKGSASFLAAKVARNDSCGFGALSYRNTISRS